MDKTTGLGCGWEAKNNCHCKSVIHMEKDEKEEQK